LLGLLATSFWGVFGQTITTGDLTGTVKDATDAVVVGATVSLKSWDTGEARTVTSNSSGGYRFNFLKPGTYQVSASTAGLKSDFSRVKIEVGQVATVDLLAKLQATQEVIEVSSTATTIDTDNANLTATYASKAVLELPAPGGDLTTVAFTVPGIAISTGGGYGNFSSHGLPGTSNLFTMNGTDYNDPYLNLNNSGASNLLLGQNEVAEASVVQNGYSVQYGRQSGAQVNYVTKSGSNAFHGSLLYNWNGDSLNANSFFSNAEDTPRARSISNQYGALLSGPIIKNKVFFLFDTEGLRYVLPSTGVVTVPSTALQNYILANLSPAQAPLYQTAFKIWNGAPGSAGAVPITNGAGPFQDSTNQLGCGNLTGTSDGGAGVFGSTVSCGQSWGTSGSNQNKEWLLTTRADWNISDKQKIFFRYKTDQGFQPTATNLLSPTLDADSKQPQYEGQINHTYVISPSIVNNFIAGVLWYSAIFGPADSSAAQAMFPVYFSMAPGGSLGGGSNGGGFYNMGAGDASFNWINMPQGRNVGQYQLIDDLSVTKSKHTIKIGGNYRRNRVTDFSDEQNAVGFYGFGSLADFANGVTNASDGSFYQQRFSPLSDTHIRFYNLGLYAQDEWAITHGLKITYGVRFDRTENPLCTDKCFSELTAPFTSFTFTADSTAPYNAAIQTGLTRAYYKVDPFVTDPRVGVVWSPGKDNTWVVRGGVGLFSDLAPGILVASVFQNPPFPYTAFVQDGSQVGTTANSNSAAVSALNQYNAFASGFANGATLAQLNATVPGGFGPMNFFSTPAKLTTPQYLEWSFEVQKQIGQKNILILTYSGNHGYHLLTQNGFANAYNADPTDFPGFGGLPTTPRDGRFLAVTQLDNSGYSNYDGLTFQYKRALAYGFSGQFNLTWSHALDTISNGGAGESYSFTQNVLTGLASPYVNASYSNADYDIRYNFLSDLIWDSPWKFQHKALNTLAGGWTISSKLFIRSGLPFSVVDSSLAGLVGGGSIGGNNQLFGSPAILATITNPGLATSCGPGTVDTPCFSASSFVASGSESTWGNYPRNTFRGPGYTDVDLSIYKHFAIREGMNLTVGASAYNVLNHPNFNPPNANVAGGGLGQIFSTAIPPTSAYGSFQGSQVSGRVIVLNGKFSF
jgi:outer membrane receptor protein involved in Fe transport